MKPHVDEVPELSLKSAWFIQYSWDNLCNTSAREIQKVQVS
jgi:hypothetical protein